MSDWCRWYQVVKRCGCAAHRYRYWQSTRRVDGRTETRNRYIGIVGGGGGARRAEAETRALFAQLLARRRGRRAGGGGTRKARGVKRARHA